MEEIINERDLVKYSDFLICSVLMYFEHTLETVDRTDASRCIFIINRKNTTEKILEKFHKGLLLVEPKRFQAIQKEIKSRLYNE
ncbi:MAG: hypothetical protein ACWGHO_02735 [Candidatus Moraniibacteriota bacterium]